MNQHPNIEALILCGGQARRMGGADKGLITLLGKPLLSWILERLSPQVGKISINANHHLNLYEQFGLEIIEDSVSGYAGPLAGFHAGLKSCKAPYLLVVPCDSPLIDDHLVNKLFEALQKNDVDLAYAATSNASQVQTHPVFCLMRKKLLPSLENFLVNDRKIDLWFKKVKTIEVIFPNENGFVNINSLEDLEKLSKLL
jgi:molybdopterin-guanine dinucleotide biosynthesis protein A